MLSPVGVKRLGMACTIRVIALLTIVAALLILVLLAMSAPYNQDVPSLLKTRTAIVETSVVEATRIP